MKAERARLGRFQRLERVRAIAKQTAAAEAAQAEGTLAQLEALAERTRQMAAEYACRVSVPDAASLQRNANFARGLHGISTNTASDAATARRIADVKLQALNQAERRRAVVEERAERQARVITRGAESPVLGARRKFGTELD
jgi:paraquat-inducible protein B